MGSSAAPDAGAYTAQYEALRARMTAGDGRGGASDARTRDTRARGVALAVLLQDGLPAWLAAVEPLLSMPPAAPVRMAMEHTAPDETRPVRTVAYAVAHDVLPLAKHAEVTLVLAALVLSTARLVPRDSSDLSPTRAHASAREGVLR